MNQRRKKGGHGCPDIGNDGSCSLFCYHCGWIQSREAVYLCLFMLWGTLLQAQGSRNKNSTKSNNICEHLEGNEAVGNYRLVFVMSHQSKLMLFVTGQDAWVGEEAADTIYPAFTRIGFFWMPPCTTSSKVEERSWMSPSSVSLGRATQPALNSSSTFNWERKHLAPTTPCLSLEPLIFLSCSCVTGC